MPYLTSSTISSGSLISHPLESGSRVTTRIRPLQGSDRAACMKVAASGKSAKQPSSGSERIFTLVILRLPSLPFGQNDCLVGLHFGDAPFDDSEEVSERHPLLGGDHVLEVEEGDGLDERQNLTLEHRLVGAVSWSFCKDHCV